jgi:hypothetical protein
MPWCEIEPDRLEFLRLFGYEVLEENDEFMMARYGDKAFIIDKQKPFLYFDDLSEIMQLGGVKGIINGP